MANVNATLLFYDRPPNVNNFSIQHRPPIVILIVFLPRERHNINTAVFAERIPSFVCSQYSSFLEYKMATVNIHSSAFESGQFATCLVSEELFNTSFFKSLLEYGSPIYSYYKQATFRVRNAVPRSFYLFMRLNMLNELFHHPYDKLVHLWKLII